MDRKYKYTAKEVSKSAILAGTLQFYRAGIQPVTRRELELEGQL